MDKKRIFLSPPHMGGEELRFIKEAFKSNYIAPLGPQVDAFEQEFAEYTGIKHCAAVSSGTAAMHLSLRHLGIGPGVRDQWSGGRGQGSGGEKEQRPEVFASTLTFIGSVTPVVFEGATPVFIDCDRESWNMDPGLLEAELERCAEKGKLPEAVIPTDLYGQCCELGRIVEICDRYGVPVVCDSAEALGARGQWSGVRGQGSERAKRSADYADYTDELPQKDAKSADGWMNGGVDEKTDFGPPASDLRPLSSDLWHHAGAGARATVFSFNGNKIMTTSGGGMLASDDEDLIAHAKKLSQQAREDFPHYEHVEIGFNYRMSNVLAAIGRGQLRVLDERVKRKREIFDYYKVALGDLPGIEFMPEPEWSRANRWLTVVLITPEAFGVDREQVRLALEEENIEARPVWKPMHLQPVFGFSRKGAKAQRRTYSCRVVGGEVSEDLFNRGLCLPSGTAMVNGDLDRVIETILNSRAKAQRKARGLFC